nr:SagB/ThcOx family dehydrogenase [Streptomyces sp. BA2]
MAGRPGLRELTVTEDSLIALADLPPGEPSLLNRRSHRRFGTEPIAFEEFSGFLATVRQYQHPEGPRSNYASADGLYPVQIHLHVKDGRVRGVPAGSFCYRPDLHSLVPLQPGQQFTRDQHAPVNRVPYDEAAFSVFLVGELAAIEPICGELGGQFSLLEAGYIGQLLMTTAAAHGLGTCPIGTVDTDAVTDLLRLGPTHHLLHSLLVGPAEPDPDGSGAAGSGSADDEIWEEGEL